MNTSKNLIGIRSSAKQALIILCGLVLATLTACAPGDSGGSSSGGNNPSISTDDEDDMGTETGTPVVVAGFRVIPAADRATVEWTNPEHSNITGVNISWQGYNSAAISAANRNFTLDGYSFLAASDSAFNAESEMPNSVVIMDDTLREGEHYRFSLVLSLGGNARSAVAATPANQARLLGPNHDRDEFADDQDPDDDNDGRNDLNPDGTVLDACPRGDTDWTSNASADHDSDGCRDAGTEDDDDDNDGIADSEDNCPTGALNWRTSAATELDLDNDGCQDATEDSDILIGAARFFARAFESSINLSWNNPNLAINHWRLSIRSLDAAGNVIGAPETRELTGAPYNLAGATGLSYNITESPGGTPLAALGNYSVTLELNTTDANIIRRFAPLPIVYVMHSDRALGVNRTIVRLGPNYDGDDYANRDDRDDDNDDVLDAMDLCDPDNPMNLNRTLLGWTSNASVDHDSDGCRDFALDGSSQGEDLDDDNDNRHDFNITDGTLLDFCPRGEIGWDSLNLSLDYDSDGCQDAAAEDTDDDNDLILDAADRCDPDGYLGMTMTSALAGNSWTSNTTTDNDLDGCRDQGAENGGLGEDTDDDNDAALDTVDARPRNASITSYQATRLTARQSGSGQANVSWQLIPPLAAGDTLNSVQILYRLNGQGDPSVYNASGTSSPQLIDGLTVNMSYDFALRLNITREINSVITSVLSDDSTYSNLVELRDATFDSDGDGVNNYPDNCPDVANPAQTDTDGDGAGDACDEDIDGDGVSNGADARPLDDDVQFYQATVVSAEQTDTGPVRVSWELMNPAISNNTAIGTNDTITEVRILARQGEQDLPTYTADAAGASHLISDLAPGAGYSFAVELTVMRTLAGATTSVRTRPSAYSAAIEVIGFNTDADGDGIVYASDSCPGGERGWLSSPATDSDGDGCRDATEDVDDDGDGLIEIATAAELNMTRFNLLGTNLTRTADDLGDARGCGGGVAPDTTPITACAGYEQVADIDLSGINWDPIGGECESSLACVGFKSIFDGNGYRISNLTIISPKELRTYGLFQSLQDIKGGSLVPGTPVGHLRNVNLRNINASVVRSSIGALVGLAAGGASITNSSVIGGRISGGGGTGGLVGDSRDAIITSSLVVLDEIVGSSIGAGGIVGVQNRARISYSTAIVRRILIDIDDGSSAGGLAGQLTESSSSIRHSLAAAHTLGRQNTIGGLVGSAGSFPIVNSLSLASAISSSGSSGPLVAGTNPSITASYYNNETLTITGTNNDRGEGRNTADLQAPTNADGFDNGIYAAWDDAWCDPATKEIITDNTDARAVPANRVWDLGTSSEYPVLRCLPLDAATLRVAIDNVLGGNNPLTGLGL